MNAIDSIKPELMDPFQGEIEALYERAKQRLPKTIVDPHAQRAWIVREVLGEAELNRNRSRSLQALLVAWIYEEHIWADHPERPGSFRDFLNGVGSDQEGNKLSPTAISHLSSIAEIILPYCRSIGIDAKPLLSGQMWPKFREAISALRKAIEQEPDPEPVVRHILGRVEALPHREAVRLEFQKQRNKKAIIGDSLQVNGKIVVALLVPPDEWPDLKSRLSRHTDWKTLMLQEGNRTVIQVESNDHRNGKE